MVNKLLKATVLAICVQALPAQIGTWMVSNRNHPELEWKTISTKQFNIHYHNGLEQTAIKSARVAEHVMPILMQQMDLDTIPKIDITLTSEDEFENGFAIRLTYQVFIWVEQNDMLLWLEKDKWLETVIAHELQHVLYFEKTKTWLPSPMDILIGNTPPWVIEGIAEYMTESWRPYRADLEHKRHVLSNPDKRSMWDPHADGFSKALYWASRFGDSTFVQVLEYRNDAGLYDFEEAFKKVTGISSKQFVEDWRVHMNTYYYSYRSQKETYEEMGKVLTLPIKRMQSFRFYSDSTRIALLGLFNKNNRDVSLILAERDTTKENKKRKAWDKETAKIKTKKKKTKKDSLRLNKRYKEKVLWKKNEADFGRFHESMSWSPDGNKIAYSKYHYAKENQSLVYDIKTYDARIKKDKWVTSSMRARFPVWVDSTSIAFVSVNKDTSNIFIADESGNVQQLTNFEGNTQILDLNVSSNYESIVFAMSPQNGNIDIYTLNIKTKTVERVTNHEAADVRPIWHSDGTAISFTSHRNGVPNIFTINLSNGIVSQNTDSGDGIVSEQWMPNSDLLLSQASIGTADSIRLIALDPFRKAKINTFAISNHFSKWLDSGPDVSFVHTNPSDTIKISKPKPYKFLKTLRLGQVIVLPPNFGIATWIDAMNKNVFGVGAILNDQDIDNSGFLLTYMTANYGPMVTLVASRNAYMFEGASFRVYDGKNIFQYQNGLSISLDLMKNFSESLSSNHTLTVTASLYDNIIGNKITEKGDVQFRTGYGFDNLPLPESGKEAIVSFGYVWKSMRPHTWNMSVPLQGHGLSFKVDVADTSVFGDFSYSRLNLDSFINIPIKLGPINNAVYLRFNTVKQSGSPPAQDYIGLTNDTPLYINGMGDLSEFLPENYNPRGWNGFALGDQLFFSTHEYRMPLLTNVASMNLISDYAKVWRKSEEVLEVFTYGAELRISLGPITASIGRAQTNKAWAKNNTPDKYLRLVLINPF